MAETLIGGEHTFNQLHDLLGARQSTDLGLYYQRSLGERPLGQQVPELVSYEQRIQ